MNIADVPPVSSQDESASSALEGLRVVDLSHFVAGPMASMILGDLGADIIKIEPPGRGDDFRATRLTGKDLHGAPFHWVNRNKRSVVLDLSLPEGLAVALELIADADVVLENFSTGVMERLGLDYERIAAFNPRIVYCSVSAAGREGPLADRAGFDPIAQAQTGFMQISGHTDGAVVAGGPAIIDMATAMMASNVIMAALLSREKTGRGQRVQVSLFDQGVTMLSYHAMTYLMSGVNPRPVGRAPRLTPAIGTYDTLDSPILLCCLNNGTYRKLVVNVLHRQDLAEAPYANVASRVRNSTELLVVLRDLLLQDTSANWLAKMHAAGVPAAPISTLEEALASDDVRDRGLLSSIPHPTLGSIPNIASPMLLSETPVVEPRAAPLLGQHTIEVLTELLGYDESQLKALALAGVFGAKPLELSHQS
jgi:crotonobetainyl-CoA:carnitine CoA-transferase CaiB-like acyl-CoA transferase